MKKIITLIMVLLALVELFSCGIKGPPLPPETEVTIQSQDTSDAVSHDQTKAINKK